LFIFPYYLNGIYYQYIALNINQAKKYYLLAIKKQYVRAMFNLGNLYENDEYNYKLAKKYYLIATKYGDKDSMFRLFWYYLFYEPNYELMKKYCLMSIKNNQENVSNIITEFTMKQIDDRVLLIESYFQNEKNQF